MNAQATQIRSGESPYVVRRPRVTDDVGESLRRVFGMTPGVPQDLHRLLGRLDCVH